MGEKVLKKRGYVFAFKSAHKVLRRVSFGILKFFGGVKQAIKKTHDKTYNKIGWYKKWSDSKTSETVHRALTIWLSLVVFVVLSITVLFTAPINTTLQAANRSVSWSTKGDFENNASTTNTPTTGDCVVDGTNPEDDATITMPKGRVESAIKWDNDTWTYNVSPRNAFTTVLAGTKMIVWGGYDYTDTLNTGGVYNTETNIWSQTSTVGAPSTRSDHTAVWTGTKMIVWGGVDNQGNIQETGGAYDPETDTWTQISTIDAPSIRSRHTAVWTGTKMIVWGGYDSNYLSSTGGSYDPLTDSWAPISVDGAPSARYGHTVVWAGTKMIVWGGYDGGVGQTNTGGVYDPETDTWSQTSTDGSPNARNNHTAVWTGTKMIIWGGVNYSDGFRLNTGGVYDPETNTWAETTIDDAPAGRDYHTAVWTGTKMIVWGGDGGSNLLDTGGSYNPETNVWTITATSDAATARFYHAAVWTGTKMIVWGGWNGNVYINTGANYSPTSDNWTSFSSENSPSAPSARENYTAVWTGTKMIIWGGSDYNGLNLNTGGVYDPQTDSWETTSTVDAPSSRFGHIAVWTGTKMIVWGGADDNGYTDTGGSYDPTSNTWSQISSVGAPSGRSEQLSVWTGTKMIVWGGYNYNEKELNSGGVYDPETDTWTQTATNNAPSARFRHTIVWAETKMIVWGGYNSSEGFLNTGGVYDPEADSWTQTTTYNAPGHRHSHSAVWTGTKMIVWGGEYNIGGFLRSGGVYDPQTDTWAQTTTINAPYSRTLHTAIWTGTKMIIWGGNNYGPLNSGAVYDPETNSWSQDTIGDAPNSRYSHTAVWTGTKMIIWGGLDNSGLANTGKIAELGSVVYDELYAPSCTISGFKVRGSDALKAFWYSLDINLLPLPSNTQIMPMFRGAITEEALANTGWYSDPYNNEINTPGTENKLLTSLGERLYDWFEIKFVLSSADGESTPTILDFTLNYSQLDAPEDLHDQTDLIQKNASTGAIIDIGAPIGGKAAVTLGDLNLTCVTNYSCSTQFEVKPVGVPFDGKNILEGNTVPSNGLFESFSINSFSVAGVHQYKWRARVTQFSSIVSAWTEFNHGNAAFYVDATPPEGRVFFENGAVRTKGSTVHLGVEATDDVGVDSVRFSNDGSEWSNWDDYQTIRNEGKLWYLLPGDGTRAVFAQFKDKTGNVSGKTWQTKSDFTDNAGSTEGITKSNIVVSGELQDDYAQPKLSYGSVQLKDVWQAGFGYFSLAIDADSNLWVTGENNYTGALGTGDMNNVPSWTKSSITDVKKVSTGRDVSYVLKNSGDLYVAGTSDHANSDGGGALGLGDDIGQALTWTLSVSNVSDVMAGGDFAYIKKSDGSYWLTGSNSDGELGMDLGLEPSVTTWTPAPEAINNVKDLQVSADSVALLKNNGELWFVGENNYGAFGLGDEVQRNEWTLSRSDVSMVGLGRDDHNVIVTTLDGKVYGCGQGTMNGLGYNTITWQEITTITDIKRLIPGHNEFLIQKTNNEYWGIGRNFSGSLGLGFTGAVTDWAKLSIPTNAKVVVPGYDMTAYIDENNQMWLAGTDNDGRMGLGTGQNYTNFVTPQALLSYFSPGILGGPGSAIGLRYDAGSVMKWSGITPDWDISDNQGIKFAVKTSDDGGTWSELLGRDGNAINWDTNYFGYTVAEGNYYLSFGAIPASRYIDITARLESSNPASTPFIKKLTLDIPISASIEVDSVTTEIYFDAGNKYPNPNWNVKENVNSVEFRFTTNKNAAVYVDFGGDNATREAGGDPVLDMNHSMKIKALNPSTTYKYRIRAVDDWDSIALMPANAESNLGSFFTFTTGNANEGFEGIPAVSEMEQVEITASTAKITWKTKIPTSSWVDYGLGIDFGSTDGSDNLTTTHVVELKNLIAGSTYYYRVRGLDAGDNEFISSGYIFRAVMQPQILEVKAENITPSTAEISWTTNVKTDSDVAYGVGNYAERVKDVGLLTAHRVTLKDLNDDTLYQYQVEARDSYGNITKSQALSFRTSLDTAGPTIEDVRIDVVPVESDQTTAQIIMSWKTNKPATTKIEYGEGVVGGTYEKSSIEDTSLNINHTVIIKELNPATSYHFRIISKDKRDNMTKSTDYTIVTPAKQKSIWQLILASLQKTFSWVSDMPKFWSNVGEKIR